MSKHRKIDYSTKEMADLSGMSTKNFTDRLKSICNDENGENRFGYNFNIFDFKADDIAITSNNYFPPEIAEPLIILIRNIDYHPYARKNAKKTEVTASQISEYTRRVLDDIDNTEYPIFKDMIYSYNAHVTSLELSYWIEPFIRSLMHFVLNSLQQYGNIGQALRHYTKYLDKFNYNLHRGMMFETKFNIEQENISIDRLLVNCINEGLNITKNNKKTGIHDFEDWLKAKQPNLPELNTSYVDEKSTNRTINTITSLPINEQRKIYLEIVLRNQINNFKLKSNIAAVEKKKSVAENWIPLDKRIENGDKEVHNEQIRNELLKKISDCDALILSGQKGKEYYQQKLDELNNTGRCSVNFNVDHLFMPTELRHEHYVSHCHTIDNDANNLPLKNVLDNMIGQALRYFMDNCEK